MAVLHRPLSPLPASPGGDVVAWIADNATKGTSAAPHAITVHTTATFSEHTWDRDADQVAAAVLAAIGVDRSDIEGAPQVHRWRFAKPSVLHTADHLLLSGLPPAVVAGDAFGGASVEGAAVSGRAAASALLS
jgi:predicted NAD/FAD-dependent oxidoreductase